MIQETFAQKVAQPAKQAGVAVLTREATVLKVKLKLIRFSKGFDYGPLD
jgi:hypothetical protein